MNEREQALSVIESALPVFQEINNLYLSAHNLNQQVMMRQVKTADRNGKSSAVLAYGAAALCFFGMSFISRIVAKITNSDIIVIVMIILTIVLCVNVYIRVKRNVKNTPAFSEYEVDAKRSQIDAISNEIYNITTANQEIIDQIPRDYRYYDAVIFLESMLVNGRADSMKEALNLYETHLHQQRLETNSQLAFEMNKRQCEMLTDINTSAKRAERNSSIAATFSILSFLNGWEK